jgi:hypothetical protein
MSVFKIDDKSTSEEIDDFYNLYVESFSDLCMWKGIQIINLDDFITPSSNKKIFIDSLESTTIGLGIIIYYTHNDDVITSIAFVEIEEPTKCYVKIKYLCGNINTKNEKINGKSCGINMLDYIFSIYNNSVILIEPATPGLIKYYVDYKTPDFPYSKRDLEETFNYLIYGNLRLLREGCFIKIFKSIYLIDKLSHILQFKSITDLYDKTNNVTDVKEKLITKLDFLVKTKQMKATYYEQLMNNIMSIQFYDIQDILLLSNEYKSGTEKNVTHHVKSGGKINRKSNKNIKNKTLKKIKLLKKI